MGKGKKAGKRITKKQLSQQLEQFFSSQPGKKLTLKDIFRALHLDTHPLKMLAMDIMEEMAWDDFITKKGENAYQLNTKGQVQEGTFVRKPNGKNSFLADGSDKPIFVAERNSMSALTGDRVRVSFMARRQKHIKEAQVIEILSRAKDTFVGRLRVDRDIAFCVTQNSTFVQDILIPKKKLKGGKTDDKVLVKIVQWPDENHKNPIGEVVDVLGKTGENNAEMCSILAKSRARSRQRTLPSVRTSAIHGPAPLTRQMPKTSTMPCPSRNLMKDSIRWAYTLPMSRTMSPKAVSSTARP